MCNLKDLQDGTYSINDLMLMHELIDFKISLQPEPETKIKGRGH